MKDYSVESYWVKIYLSGDIGIIEQSIREHICGLRSQRGFGLCVTVTPNKYIYPGGEELGVEIGLLNYPRFPESNYDLFGDAYQLALTCLEKSFQDSVLLLAPDKTTWITKREAK